MPTGSVPFQDLAERIQQQEAELAKLRQELESRRGQLSELTRRKEGRLPDQPPRCPARPWRVRLGVLPCGLTARTNGGGEIRVPGGVWLNRLLAAESVRQDLETGQKRSAYGGAFSRANGIEVVRALLLLLEKTYETASVAR